MVKNLARFKRRMKKIPVELKKEILKSFEKTGPELVKFQQQLAPFDTGELKEKHRHRIFKRQLKLRVESLSFYASFQEFGTRNIPAQPSFFPAYRALKKRFKSRLTRHINKGIKKAIRTR